LATGLAISSPIDDAVKFFQAKTLSDRAGDLTSRKDGIEEGANLLALQTRQQLDSQSLAFAGQSEQSILGLFR
jgi:flagellin